MLALTLLRSLRVEVPAHQGIELVSSELNDVIPTEYRADLVLVLRREGRAVFAIVLEVQLAVDADKTFTWPVYLATLRARHRCPACLLVFASTRRVARWASRVIELGPGGTCQPSVIGPEGVPQVQTLEEALREPELAVLSAVAHARSPRARHTAVLALAAACSLTADETKLYSDWILSALGPAARRAMEEMMALNFEPRSELVREWLATGKAEGLAAGKAEGLAAGKAEGLADGLAEAVLAVLDARLVACGAEQREKIRACRDEATLRRWLRGAVSVTQLEELFARS